MTDRDSAGAVRAVPSVGGLEQLALTVRSDVPTGGLLGVPVASAGPVPSEVGLAREQLARLGFDGAVGSSLLVPGEPARVAFGIGDPASADVEAVRDAAAALARATRFETSLSLVVPEVPSLTADVVAQAIVEGAVLARYAYDPLRSTPKGSPLVELTLVAGEEAAVAAGSRRGLRYAEATSLARDLANSPHSHLSASVLAELAQALLPGRGIEVEVFDKPALEELGCGGLLGVNAGSVEPPRMIVLRYRPEGVPTGHLGIVGKGIMYDSGGLSLKPGDEVHAQMKNDMSGAAAVFAAMAVLHAVGCPTQVTAWLMCTDNMPSGTAMALGDVITMRGGTTVEVVNTDAEGRLVMADALVLATEAGVDAVVDIATLTGAAMRALGDRIAGVMGTSAALVDQIRAAAVATSEPVWELPLEPKYRSQLDSTVADLRNLGGPLAGAITAGLFLREFVGDTPWAHVDIAGTAQTPADTLWHTAGCSGFGARLLVQLAADFAPPS